MSHRFEQFARYAVVAALFVAFAYVGPAAAQRSVPVTIENDESEPVPVYQAGRTPYQFVYSISATGSGDECDVIPVPAGMMLTITNIAVDGYSDDSTSPNVRVLASRTSGSGGSFYRHRMKLEYESTSGTRRYYSGLQNTSIHAGPADGVMSYRMSICVTAPDTGYANARGFVTGYVEAATIIDGNQIP